MDVRTVPEVGVRPLSLRHYSHDKILSCKKRPCYSVATWSKALLPYTHQLSQAVVPASHDGQVVSTEYTAWDYSRATTPCEAPRRDAPPLRGPCVVSGKRRHPASILQATVRRTGIRSISQTDWRGFRTVPTERPVPPKRSDSIYNVLMIKSFDKSQ
jgi:hypothetical protein